MFKNFFGKKDILPAEMLSAEEAEKEARAVKYFAEQEGGENPPAENYEKESVNMDMMRENNPEITRKFVESANVEADIKEEMGPEKAAAYQEAIKELSEKLSISFEVYWREAKDETEKRKIKEEFLQVLEERLRKDRRIEEAFADNQEILDKAIEASKASFVVLMESLYK